MNDLRWWESAPHQMVLIVGLHGLAACQVNSAFQSAAGACEQSQSHIRL